MALCAVVVGCARAPRAALGGAEAALRAASAAAEEAAASSARQRALDAARLAARGAIPQPDDRLARNAFLHAARTGDAAAANRIRAVWVPHTDDPKCQLAVAQLALRARRFDSARSVAWDAVERFPEHRDAFVRLWLDTVAQDPDLVAPVTAVDLRPDRTPDESEPAVPLVAPPAAIEYLGGGSTLTFRFNAPDGTPIAAFKPAQTRQQSSYRGELAAYRLCTLLHCGFDIPRNVEVRVERGTFLSLLGVEGRRATARFDRRYADLVWTVDSGGTEWLHGTRKDWVPSFRRFAIEDAANWSELLEHDGPGRASVETIMARGFDTDGDGRPRFVDVHTDLDDLTIDALARQLSNLHVFDFVTNNWDRYSRHYPGVNCQWTGDHFVSIDNGAAFGPRDQHGVTADRVALHLRPVERFSRRTISALRWMPADLLFPILFPPTPARDAAGYGAEKALFADFLSRREALLDHVDALVDRYGEDEVMSIE